MAAAINPTSLATTLALLYGAAIDMVTQLQLRYATPLYSYAMATVALKVKAKKFPHANFQFSSRCRNQEDGDDNSEISSVSVADDAAFEYVMDNGSSRIWSTSQCRPTQHQIIVLKLSGSILAGALFFPQIMAINGD